MKKILGFISVVIMVVVLGGCGSKEATETFTQTPTTGTEIAIIVKHKGDKITDVSCETTFDNDVLQITDEKTAKQMVKVFEQTSNLKDTKMTYGKKQTVITYKESTAGITSGTSYKDSEKSLKALGFEKK